MRSDDGVVTSDVDGNHATKARRGRARGWPLRAAAGVGRRRAVAGGGIGEFAGHRVERDIHDHSDG